MGYDQILETDCLDFEQIDFQLDKRFDKNQKLDQRYFLNKLIG